MSSAEHLDPSVGADCPCGHQPQPASQYRTLAFLGTDATNGRYGDVSLKQCCRCDRLWLHYFLTYEDRPNSGRYFLGAITPERAQTLGPTDAVAYLGDLEGYFYGGSYFAGQVGRRHGPPPVDR
jgi:hypothetical protein